MPSVNRRKRLPDRRRENTRLLYIVLAVAIVETVAIASLASGLHDANTRATTYSKGVCK